MWIKTSSGRLLNLARCTMVAVEAGEHPGDVRLVASDGAKVVEVVADKLTHSQAEELLHGLGRRGLKASEIRPDGDFWLA